MHFLIDLPLPFCNNIVCFGKSERATGCVPPYCKPVAVQIVDLTGDDPASVAVIAVPNSSFMYMIVWRTDTIHN